MQTHHRFVATGALRMQVEVPLLEPGRDCCQCAHIRISVGRGQGLTCTGAGARYATAMAEVRSAISRSFSVIPPSECVVQRTVTRR